MTPGSIVSYKNFTFHDGGQADKLLVVLNSGGKRPYLVVKTTSQQKAGRQQKEGCQAKDGYYYLPARRDNFPINTWIILDEYYEVTAADFLQKKFSGEAEIKGSLRTETLSAIINCARKSEDWSEHFDSLLK